jgi:hypothetical protein
MARIDRFYIGQVDGSGLQTDLRPYAIPDTAFAQLDNAYVFRGRVRKRFGARLTQTPGAYEIGYETLNSRLRINLGTTNGAGNLGGTVPGNIFQVGQMFSIGAQVYTVNVTGLPAPLLNTGAGTGFYNTATGVYAFFGAAALTDVYFYPAQPVMGFANFGTGAVSQQLTFAFDTQFAYQFLTSGWQRLGASPIGVWTGDNADFFWSSTWRGTSAAEQFLFVSNYNVTTALATTDPIKYWDGTLLAWSDFTPGFSASDPAKVIVTARIILPFKGRLILLNVVENEGGNNIVYVNRCRFSYIGNPTAADAFYVNGNNANYQDAPTKEAIVTAQFLKDRLIVYFEASTWELVYTNNEIEPFIWQKINTELGAESTFSQVPFDKVVFGVGNVGIHACNGSNVDRIDQNIPTAVFEIHNENNGVERVFGIRDFYVEMVYWSFPGVNQDSDFPFNNRVLTYNYKSQTWGFNDDSITAFGYIQAAAQEGSTWQSIVQTWEEYELAWNNGVTQAQFKAVLAGNQEGFVFIVSPDISTNCPALQITDMDTLGSITAINHNLSPGDFVKIDSAQGITDYNDLIFKVDSITSNSVFVVDLNGVIPVGVYIGAGTITRVSNIDIRTKQYNFYYTQGRNAFVSKVDFLVDKTTSGAISVDYFVSASTESMIEEGTNTAALLGTSVLETSPYALVPLEQTQSRLWHPVYLQADGECIQLRLYLTDEQMLDASISQSDFELHGMLIFATPTSSRLQ